MRIIGIRFGVCYNFFALPFCLSVEEDEDEDGTSYAIHFLCFYVSLYILDVEDEA
jgi:hypothetical protein